jgi:hypothetical protein
MVDKFGLLRGRNGWFGTKVAPRPKRGKENAKVGVLMLVRDILARLRSGEKLKEIAPDYGRSETWIQRRLRAIGYRWDNSAKVWEYAGEGEEPLDLDLSMVSGSSHHGNTTVLPYDERDHTGEVHNAYDSITLITSDSPLIHTEIRKESYSNHTEVTPSLYRSSTRVIPLSDEEISGLRELLRSWKNNQSVGPSLFDAVGGLPGGSKVRKTILVREEAYQAFDAFCESHRMFEKGDLFSLALLEFIERYGGRK